MDYMAALTSLQDELDVAERPAVLSRAKINPPCVYIALRGLDLWTLCNGAEASVHLWVIVGDRDDENALIALGPHLDAVLAQLEDAGLPIEAVAADQVSGTDSTTPLPAFRIETHLSIPS